MKDEEIVYSFMKVKVVKKIDYGSIILEVTQKDIESLQTVISNYNFPTPNVKISIYKNRRGKYKGIYLWCKANLGTCRIEPVFATNYRYSYIPIENTKIIVDQTKERG